MTVVADPLPLRETRAPERSEDVALLLRAAHERRQAVYPIGGGTSLDLGRPGARPGCGLSLSSLSRVIDYPARDMTITVESGITLAALAAQLAAERQWFPVEGGMPAQATLGGLLATNFSGPRRYGWGAARDYVIGVSAVDGRGVAFKAGGRVVKNVAGYDFCKLLVGSMGTLAVMTQVTLKLKPIPEHRCLVVQDLANWDEADSLLASLTCSQTTPTMVELLSGPAWQGDEALPPARGQPVARLIIGLEGTTAEVAWMRDRLAQEWRNQAAAPLQVVSEAHAPALEGRLVEFPAAPAPLVLKVNVVPSAITAMAKLLAELDSQASITAHAGNGIMTARLEGFAAGDISSKLIQRIQPAAASHGGAAIVLSSRGLGELTPQAVWGLPTAATALMRQLKRQFDPRDILNPGRFVV